MKKEAMPLEDDCRKWQVQEIHVTAMVCKGPSAIAHIHVVPENPALVYFCDIYDGENAMGALKFDIRQQFTAYDENPTVPFYFERGIFVNFTQNVGSVTIQFNPIRI